MKLAVVLHTIQLFKLADTRLNLIGSYQRITVCTSSTAIPPIGPKTSQLERKCPKHILCKSLQSFSERTEQACLVAPSKRVELASLLPEENRGKRHPALPYIL